MEIGVLAACTKRVMEATKGLGQRDVKVATNYCSFLTVGFTQRGRLKL